MPTQTSKSIADAYVDAKAGELAADIAKGTGVDPATVAKVLDHLGVRTALANRLKVDLGTLRVAASDSVR